MPRIQPMPTPRALPCGEGNGDERKNNADEIHFKRSGFKLFTEKQSFIGPSFPGNEPLRVALQAMISVQSELFVLFHCQGLFCLSVRTQENTSTDVLSSFYYMKPGLLSLRLNRQRL